MKKANLNKKTLNVVMLNTVRLNNFGVFGSKQQPDSGDAPSGYELFKASDGDFNAIGGQIYVKL